MGHRKQGGGGGGDDGAGSDALSTFGAIMGDEAPQTDIPRSVDYPTPEELASLARHVDASIGTQWVMRLQEIFGAARAICAEDTSARPGRAPRGREALLTELERRLPGAAMSRNLLPLLKSDAVLFALVDALIVIDEFEAASRARR